MCGVGRRAGVAPSHQLLQSLSFPPNTSHVNVIEFDVGSFDVEYDLLGLRLVTTRIDCIKSTQHSSNYQQLADKHAKESITVE